MLQVKLRAPCHARSTHLSDIFVDTFWDFFCTCRSTLACWATPLCPPMQPSFPNFTCLPSTTTSPPPWLIGKKASSSSLELDILTLTNIHYFLTKNAQTIENDRKNSGKLFFRLVVVLTKFRLEAQYKLGSPEKLQMSQRRFKSQSQSCIFGYKINRFIKIGLEVHSSWTKVFADLYHRLSVINVDFKHTKCP